MKYAKRFWFTLILPIVIPVLVVIAIWQGEYDDQTWLPHWELK